MKAFICLLVTLVASSEARSAWKLTFGQTKASCPTVATKSEFDIASVSSLKILKAVTYLHYLTFSVSWRLVPSPRYSKLFPTR